MRKLVRKDLFTLGVLVVFCGGLHAKTICCAVAKTQKANVWVDKACEIMLFSLKTNYYDCDTGRWCASG